MHHGHFEGAVKRKGDQALCARCLARGDRHEETVMHAVHECPESAEVWATIARTWEATASEPLDTSSPILTVLGLRPRPSPEAPTQTRERFEAREAACLAPAARSTPPSDGYPSTCRQSVARVANVSRDVAEMSPTCRGRGSRSIAPPSRLPCPRRLIKKNLENWQRQGEENP